MTTEQYINRLCRNIKAERFAWDKYLTPQNYFGKELCVTPLHASYGQIGYTIHFPYSREPMPELVTTRIITKSKMQYEQVCILDFILYFILGICLLSSCDHVSWAFRHL